jgi:hypothetical protein
MIKLLLDENLPVRLKNNFPKDILVLSVYEMGWNSFKNGDLLKIMSEQGFAGLITSDQNLVYQQNIRKFNLLFFIIKVKDNRYHSIIPFMPKLIDSILSESDEQVRIIS